MLRPIFQLVRTVLARGLGAVAQLLVTFLLARLYGASGAGVLFIGVTLVLITSTIARLGFEYTLIRIAAPAFSEERLDRFWGVTLQALSIVTLTSLGLAFTLAAIGFPLLWMFSNEPRLIHALPWFLAALPTFSLVMLLGELFKSSDRPSLGNLVPTALTPIGFGLLSWSLYVSGFTSTTAAAIAYFIASAFAFAFGYGLLNFLVTRPNKLEKVSADELWRPAKSLLWFSSLSVLNNWIPLIVLSLFATSDDWGRFGAVTRLATAVSFILWASNAVVPPRLARLYSTHDYRAMQSLLSRMSLSLTTIAFVPVAILILGGPWILALMGTEFVSAHYALIILSIAQLFIVAVGSVDYLLVVTGHETSLRRGAVIASVVNVALCLGLVPWFNVTGAALAAGLSILVERLWYAWSAWRYTGMITVPYYPVTVAR